ncbi:MAG: hypothetical protein KBB29_10185 [Bacteroidales bacterium]|jgi:hypothetical protein|nr:hypothetical protein [Bacteroidales bacterium]MBP8644449.1 hypothetical protein [Bacteroidales bacterium]HPA67239.1 hypothetical protein [Tenuifilaceae bacterium]HRC94902.1 hypothetical protein [Tenuifilaceae bacterium]
MSRRPARKPRIATTLGLILLALLSLRINALHQDEGKFSGNPLLFPTEVKTIIPDLGKDDEAYLKAFSIFWLSDSIPEDQKGNIIETANLILPILPESKAIVLDYIKLAATFYRDSYANKNYAPWNGALKQLLLTENLDYNKLLAFFRFTRNTVDSSFLRQTISYTWKVSPHHSYNFEFSSNQLLARFTNVNLVCITGTDSIYIEGTSGYYNPENDMWVGSKGKVTWVRSGYPKDAIFAMLSSYRFPLSKNSYTVDSVYFTNKDYFDRPARGTLTDKLVKDYKPTTIDYPEFKSYDNWFKIKNLFERVDYEGGYIMRGSRLLGVGSGEQLAKVSISRNGKPFLKVEGNIMIFERSILTADRASILFRFEEDSIYHNGLYFSYNNNTRTVTILPTERITSQSPFYSSYHKLSIWTDQLSWNIDGDKLIFGASRGSSIGNASFESNNFFNEVYFDQLMGPSDRHPLLEVWNFSVRNKSKTFLATDLAQKLRKPVEEVKIEMMRMAKLGYVLYDFETDEVQVTEKLKHTVMAKFQKVDYDVIRFSSTCPQSQPNAELDIASMNMKINGVNNISVSDSQNVFINPYNQQVIMQKNRNFEFAGEVQAGLFRFYGSKYRFNYDEFKIDLLQVDSLKLDYQTRYRDGYGRKILQSVANTFHIIGGDIVIDKPSNKSGLQSNPDYPIFHSTQKSYVYYDDPSIFNGIYKRDSFYFEIQPFTYVNMDNFEQSDLDFKGILYSRNILAPIEENLVLRPDNSLGFIKSTPPEGLALYRGKGKVFDKIDLSNRGLTVKGQVGYITSTTRSDDIFLFPDSMVTSAASFTMEKQVAGVEFPNVTGDLHHVKWLPQNDKLFVTKGEKPFKMYDSLGIFSGDLLLQPLGLTGIGSMSIPNAALSASLFEFNADDFTTPVSSLTLYSPANQNVALTTKDVRSKISFKSQTGEFSKTNQSLFATLDELGYEAYLDRFSWNMVTNNLAMQTLMQQQDVKDGKFRVSNMVEGDSIPKGSLFYSVKSSEDSLYFFSAKSTYNTATAELNADSVSYIVVADATIMPKDKKIRVNKPNRMLPLSEATIKANNLTAYHRFFDADVSIISRNSYSGKGHYYYADENDSLQTIYFTQIKVDSARNTVATGTITEPDSFTLSPQFAFVGQVHLSAPQKLLYFEGGAKPSYQCTGTTGQWIKFEALIDPRRVLIPITEQPKNLNLHPLISGSVISEDSIKVYGGLLRNRKNYDDKPLVNASGYLSFNNNNRRFTIAPLHKLSNPDTSGSSVSLQKDFCMVFSDGLVKLPVNLGQVKLNAAGSTTHKLEGNDLTLDLVLQLNFHFNQKSLEAIALELNQSFALEKVDLSRKLYRKALYQLVDSSELHAAISQLDLFGSFSQIPKGYESTITFSDLKMRWNPLTKSFVSKGKLGIGTIGNIQVNRFVNGYIEIFKRRSGDLMTLYLDFGEDRYYVFTYTKSVMQVSSNNPEFVQPIEQQKSSETRLKVKPGEPGYRYLIGTKKALDQAQQRYNQLMSGDEDKVAPPEDEVVEEGRDKVKEKGEKRN